MSNFRKKITQIDMNIMYKTLLSILISFISEDKLHQKLLLKIKQKIIKNKLLDSLKSNYPPISNALYT